MKCVTVGCKNKARKGRKLCCTCKNKQYRVKYPLKYIYQAWKSNALRRGKEHTVTFDEFEEFCKQTGYDEHKGRFANCLSIDRIKPWLGYTKDNIRAITVSDNSKLARGEEVDIPEEYRFTDVEAPF